MEEKTTQQSQTNARHDAREGGSERGVRHDRDNRSRARRAPRERVRSEFEQKIISIRRVTRVVAGGRRFNFSVAIVIGNGRGQVGVGLGKGADTAAAIDKALADARKNMITIPITKELSIPHETSAKFASSTLMMLPAPGRGLKAGSSVRTVLELSGIKHVSAKILSRSKNRLNNARATTAALAKLKI